MVNKKLLTVQEAAADLRVSRSTIWRWCRDGTLSSAFKIGRNWRIHRSEVERIMGQKLVENKVAGNMTEVKAGILYKTVLQ